jgi:hypothetical protein
MSNVSTPFQTILMNAEGLILESDNLLFNALEVPHSDLKLLFPVLDSFFHQLKQLTGNRSSLLVQGVEQPSEQLAGIYDFVFERVGKEPPIAWLLTIRDKTTHYQHLIAQQQIAHEKHIFGDIQREHSRAIEQQTTALYKQSLDRMLRLAQATHESQKLQNIANSRAFAQQWIDWFNSNPPQNWFEQSIIQSDAYREIQQKTAQHWLTKDAEAVADFEIHTVMNDLAAYFSARSDSNFVELNILYHPNMPLAKVRGNELLVRRVLLGAIVNTLKIGGVGSVSLAATPIEYSNNICKIEISLQVSWLPNLSKPLHLLEFPITVKNQADIPEQTFNVLARYHCLATWVAEAGSVLQIQQQPEQGFKVVFCLDFEKL